MGGDTGLLGVDFGTSHTVAVLQRRGGPPLPLLFDASPLLASGVFAGGGPALLTGMDAERAAAGDPARFEPHPKRHIDDGTVWLGEREVAVADLIAAVLSRVAGEAQRVAGGPPAGVMLTHPAAWGRTRLDVLGEAARRSGLGAPTLVPEPVAAAAYFASVLERELPRDRCLLVYDLGAGTFDVSVVRRTAEGFSVVATDGLADVGGLDLDAAVVEHLRATTADATEAWGRLDWPRNSADQRVRQALWRNARLAKEQLTRYASATVHVPLVEREPHLTREEFEQAARPHLERTVELTVSTLRATGVSRKDVAGVFLVGGASRVPLVSTLLHRSLGIPPTLADQPELVVAQGAPHAVAAGVVHPDPPPLRPDGTTEPAAPAGPAVHIASTAPTAATAPTAPTGVGDRPAVVADRPIWLRRRFWVPASAAAIVVLLVVVGVVWKLATAPRDTGGVTLTAAGSRNAELFDDDVLLSFAAAWLNDTSCSRRQPPRFATEQVECQPGDANWTVDFTLLQSDDARTNKRAAVAAAARGKPGFLETTYTATRPESGRATFWADADGTWCYLYWDDDRSHTAGELRQRQALGDDADADARLTTLREDVWEQYVRVERLTPG